MEPIHKAAWCHLVLIDGVERGFVATLSMRGAKVRGLKRVMSHRTAVLLPRSHPAYLRLWSAISDAQAQNYTNQGWLFYGIAPADHAAYRAHSPVWMGSQRQDSNGCLHHEYVGMPAVLIKYGCSLCHGIFDVTQHKVPPHYDEHHGTWHSPVNRPDIKGWSSMNTGEKQSAARAAGCPYCLSHNSSRSCPAHGWSEKRHDHVDGRPKTIEPHTDTWNPWIGCRKTSAACANCLMFLNRGAKFKNFGSRPKDDPANIHLCTSTWDKPRALQKRAAGESVSCMVCASSDFFLEEADAWRDDAWKVIKETPDVTYLIQTKRTERIAAHLPADWGTGYPNVWLGASVEQKRYLYRLDDLRSIPCVLRYADNVAMLEDIPEIEKRLDGIGWILAGGEKGCNVIDPRPWNPDWARHIRDICKRREFHFGSVT